MVTLRRKALILLIMRVLPNFNIRGGETTPVETTCKLANTKISIEYTDDFKQYFKTYSSTVQADLGSEVSFSSGETRAAYVKPGSKFQ